MDPSPGEGLRGGQAGTGRPGGNGSEGPGRRGLLSSVLQSSYDQCSANTLETLPNVETGSKPGLCGEKQSQWIRIRGSEGRTLTGKGGVY